MAKPDRLPPDGPAADLERRLLGWTPAPPPSTAGRDRMLFEAGVAAGRRRGSTRAAGLAAVVVLGLGGWIGAERSARSRLEVALAEQARALEVARARPPAPPSPASYLIRNRRPRADAVDPAEPGANPLDANLFPRGGGPVLTPRSTRRLGDGVEL